MRRAQFSPGFYSTITELLEEPVDVPRFSVRLFGD
jgi:hypothetical protein